MSPERNSGDLPVGEETPLLEDLGSAIEAARGRVAAALNGELVMLYWNVGARVHEHILGGERAQHDAEIMKRIAARLTLTYGRAFGWRNLFRMVRFAEAYPDPEVLSPLARQLTWSNVAEVLTLDDPWQRDFYLSMAARERWSKRTLRAQIAGRLYERMVAAGGSTAGIEAKIAGLRGSDTSTAELTFRDPYVLDFLGLPAIEK
jgi:hypothetical protein